MIANLQPYGKIKKLTARTGDVNIPWLVSLPEHWSMVRSKRLFTARKERARPDDEQLSATQAYGVIPQKDFEQRVGRKVVRITQHLEKRAHVERDDFVISMRSFQGGLERAWAKGCIRSSYVVLKPSPEAHIGYFAHLFKCHDYIRALQATSNFIRDGQDLNFANFCLVDLPLPAPDEQVVIARFLDWTNARIERAIRAKKKLIALLNEQKQAIIHRAVTQGLNPNVALKPSGIPWLGDIPKHWKVRKLRTVADMIVSNVDKHSKSSEEPVRLCNYTNVYKNEIITSALDFMVATATKDEITKFKIRIGDVIITKDSEEWDDIGIPALVGHEADDLICGYHLAMLRTRMDILHGEFLFRALQDRFVATQMHVRAKGVTRYGLSHQGIKEVLLPIPPTTEQDAICDALTKDLSRFNAAVARAESEIELLREYRTRLVADVVTGKVDVRPAGRQLPAKPEVESAIPAEVPSAEDDGSEEST